MEVAFSYGLHSLGDRKKLWEELDITSGNWIQLGIIMGHLNIIFDASELEDGCDWLARNSMGFPKTQGHFFSWVFLDIS